VERSTGLELVVGPNDKMSKSKRNTVDPQDIIARYGADTARWFVLSDNPPERDMEWTETGIAGAHRFAQRLYRLAASVTEEGSGSGPETDGALDLLRMAHRSIVAVTTALDQFAFNIAVARLHELLSAIAEEHRANSGSVIVRQTLNIFCRLLAPMMPHLAAETLVKLHPEQAGRPDLSWPVADAALTVVDTVTIAVQVGGKLRGTISVPAEADKEAVLAAAALEENVARLLAGKRVVKQIYVPGRIVNFVVVDAA
jgi:leucyl-tRNA synthetase